MNETKATPTDAGCWIDGHWGQYGIARMVEIAASFGYADAGDIDRARRHLATAGPSDTEAIELTDDEHEQLSWSADNIEAWMNEHAAPEGFSFGWHDGEFFLWSDESWAEESY